jgi:ribonuclease Z
MQDAPNRAIYQHLASPEDAGRVFAEARPKLAVYSHIGLNGNAAEEDLIAHTRSIYDGPLQVGRDLMSIDVGAANRRGAALSARRGIAHRAGVFGLS